MAEKVFLHYTQEELNRNFDQRGWVSNALEVIGRYPVLSQATRSRLKHRANVAYGPGEDETLDIFPAEGSGRPVQIFVHGGAWRNFTKDDYSFPADAYVPSGIHTVIVNFTNLPKVRLPQMVDQVRRAIEWVYRNAKSFGGDPEKVYVSAQSSGAHLSAMALTAGDFVRAATLVSGPYFMEPVMLSARSSYVQLSKAEEHELSPGLYAHRIKCPVIVAYAEHDTDEFQRQSREFAAALDRAGRLQKVLRLPAVNHFELMECMDDAQHGLMRAILGQMGIPEDKEVQ
jgi:arylformamidase